MDGLQAGENEGERMMESGIFGEWSVICLGKYIS